MDLTHNHTRRRLPKWAAASSSFWFFGRHRNFGHHPSLMMIGGIVIESSGSVPSGPSRDLSPSARLMSCPSFAAPGLWSLGPGLASADGPHSLIPHQDLFPPLEGNKGPRL